MSQPGDPSQLPPQQKPSVAYGQQPAPGYAPRPGYAPPQPSGENQVGMIAMICGLLSLAMGCPLSIAAIILGLIGLKNEPKGMAMTGLILGIVTLALNVLLGCFIVAIYGIGIGSIFALAFTVPPMHTAEVFQQKAAEFEVHKSANGSYPGEADGTAMVAGTRDGWGNPIVYRMQGEEYVLRSAGPDGVLDNDDDLMFDADEYDPNWGTASGDSSDMYGPTQDALTDAYTVIEDHWLDSDSDYFPPDAEGQALIGHLHDEWGNPIVYRQTEGGESYVVISSGPDGALDTADDLNPYAE